MYSHDQRQMPLMGMSGTTRDIKQLAPLFARLHERGWDVQLPPTSRTTQPQAGTSAAVGKLVVLLVGISGRLSSAAQAEYRAALTQGVLVVPLLLRRGAALPDDLRQTQWIDATHSLRTAWSDLLLVLDLAQLTWHPSMTTRPLLDVDVIEARATRGLVPPNWDVYHSDKSTIPIFPIVVMAFAVVFFGLTLITLGIFLLLTPQDYYRDYMSIAVEISGFIPLATIFIGVRMYIRLRTRDFVVITPTGFIHIIGEKRSVVPFAAVKPLEATTTSRYSSADDETLHMRDLLSLGRYYNTMQSGTIVRQAMDAFVAYQRRQAGLSSTDERSTAPALFISYARQNSTRADQLDEHLRAYGFNTWIDRRMLVGGQRWNDELHHAIATSAALVLVVSPAAMRSRAVREEYENALAIGKPVVAVRARRTFAVPQHLRNTICGAFARTRYWTYRTCYFPLAMRLADVGVSLSRQAGKPRFEPDRAWGTALASQQLPVNWHLFHDKLTSKKSRAIFLGFYTVSLVSMMIVFAILHWMPANLPLWLGVAIIGGYAFLSASIPLWITLREPTFSLVTPLGFVGLGLHMRAWDFGDFTEIRRDSKRPDYLELTLAATGAKMEYQVEGSSSETIIAVILAAFLSYKKQVAAENTLISTRPIHP